MDWSFSKGWDFSTVNIPICFPVHLVPFLIQLESFQILQVRSPFLAHFFALDKVGGGRWTIFEPVYRS